MRGAPGTSASSTGAQIAGSASGIFDIASGQLEFHTTPVGGFVNFRDNDAALVIDRGAGTSYSTPAFPFGATLYGFQTGDVINLHGPVAASGFAYNPSSHLLTLNAADGSSLGQFIVAGSYEQRDFQLTPVGAGGVGASISRPPPRRTRSRASASRTPPRVLRALIPASSTQGRWITCNLNTSGPGRTAST